MCQTHAESFATERIGWLHRKTEIQKEKLFSTAANSTSPCWSFCFAFLCLFLFVFLLLHALVQIFMQR